jgi:TRAP-type uncharacterized transport system fused permease subunit
MFVYQPVLLLQGGLVETILTVVTGIIGIYALAAGIEGYIHDYLEKWKRFILIVSGVCTIYPSLFINILSVLIIAYIYFKNSKESRSTSKQNVVSAIIK